MRQMQIVRADITQEAVDAIVNAANAGLYPGGGVCRAIHTVGGEAVTEECLAYPGPVVHADTGLRLSDDQILALLAQGSLNQQVGKRRHPREDADALAAELSRDTSPMESLEKVNLASAVDKLGDGLAFRRRRFYTERCPTGAVRVTTAGAMPARYCLHAVGPVWIDGDHGEAEQLAAVHRNIIAAGAKINYSSIALPAIATGIFGFPLERAADIAVQSVHAALTIHPEVERACFCVIDDATEEAYTQALEKI